MSSGKNKIRTRLFKEDPYCPRCGVKMILPGSLKEYAPGKISYFPPNTCTYQHTYSRFQKDKRKNNRTDNPGTILCKQCNEELGAIEELEYLQSKK